VAIWDLLSRERITLAEARQRLSVRPLSDDEGECCHCGDHRAVLLVDGWCVACDMYGEPALLAQSAQRRQLQRA
jgi:hypothetical protein